MLKKLKSLFIVDDEEFVKQAGKQDAPAAKAPPSKPSSAKTPSKPTSSTISSGKPSSKFTNVLLGAMDKNNIEGFDYLEFKQSLQNLSKMPMDETTRYQSAFAMAKTMGATPAGLIKTAGHYVRVLQAEEQKFQQALQNQRSKQIADKEAQQKQLEGAIKEKSKRILELNKEIEAHQKKMDKLRSEIAQSSVKVESTKNDFMASFQLIVGQIQKDIDNMKRYLKG